MSIEKALADMTAAIQENTATLRELSGKTAAAASKPAARTAAPAKADEAAEKPAGRGRGRPAKEKAFSVTEMAEKAKAFAEGAGENEAEFQERRKFLSKLADEFGVEKFSAIKGEDQATALERIEDFLADTPASGGEEY